MKIEGGSEIEANSGGDGAETKESSDTATKPIEGDDKTGLKMEEDNKSADEKNGPNSDESVEEKKPEGEETNGSDKVPVEDKISESESTKDQQTIADSSAAALNGDAIPSEVNETQNDIPMEPEAPVVSVQDGAQAAPVPAGTDEESSAVSESAENLISKAPESSDVTPDTQDTGPEQNAEAAIVSPEATTDPSVKADESPEKEADSKEAETTASEEEKVPEEAKAEEPTPEKKSDEKSSDQSEETERETRSGLRRGRSSQREDEAKAAARDSESEAEREESSERRRSGSRRKKDKVVVNSKCILDADPITDGPLKVEPAATPEK